jgi:hypothetical protein
MRAHVIKVLASSHKQPDQTLTMRKHVTRALPKSAVKLSPTVWYMARTPLTFAQVFTRHDDWAYFMPAETWNANGMIQPWIEVLA